MLWILGIMAYAAQRYFDEVNITQQPGTGFGSKLVVI